MLLPVCFENIKCCCQSLKASLELPVYADVSKDGQETIYNRKEENTNFNMGYTLSSEL